MSSAYGKDIAGHNSRHLRSEAEYVPYAQLSYSEMRYKLRQLAEGYPDVMRMETAKERFDIGYEVECEEGALCELDI